MRKTLMIFLVLVLVCGCGTALAAQAVSAPARKFCFRSTYSPATQLRPMG